MNLEQLITVQRLSQLGNVHLAYIGEHGFLIAHTDFERDQNIPLQMCHLHQWLENRAGPPAPVGVYIATNEQDGWQLQSLDLPFISDGPSLN